MKQTIFQALIVFLILSSCSEDVEQENPEIKTGTGTVWLSGGLYFCSTQIRMENGDTLIPVNEHLVLTQGGKRLNISFVEFDPRESGCSIGKDCEIIEFIIIE